MAGHRLFRELDRFCPVKDISAGEKPIAVIGFGFTQTGPGGRDCFHELMEDLDREGVSFTGTTLPDHRKAATLRDSRPSTWPSRVEKQLLEIWEKNGKRPLIIITYSMFEMAVQSFIRKHPDKVDRWASFAGARWQHSWTNILATLLGIFLLVLWTSPIWLSVLWLTGTMSPLTAGVTSLIIWGPLLFLIRRATIGVRLGMPGFNFDDADDDSNHYYHGRFPIVMGPKLLLLQVLNWWQRRRKNLAPALPVLRIHGDQDKVVPISCSQMAVADNDSTVFIPIPGAGHDVLDAYDSFRHIVRDFLLSDTNDLVGRIKGGTFDTTLTA